MSVKNRANKSCTKKENPEAKDGFGVFDVLDLVYANNKVSDSSVKIKDYRAVDFNSNYVVDEADTVVVRGTILG